MDKIYIAIDFDGTCVTHEFPNEGKDIGAVPVLKRLVKEGHGLILYTMRSGAHLESAVQWFLKNGVKLAGIQYNPNQTSWTSSNKCYAQLYIDDAALGAPLKFDKNVSDRHFVDWTAVEAICEMDGILPPSSEFLGAIREDMEEANQKSAVEQRKGLADG